MAIRPLDHKIEDGACPQFVANKLPHSVDEWHWVRFDVRPSLDLAFRAATMADIESDDVVTVHAEIHVR
jgi:hypothetical protein